MFKILVNHVIKYERQIMVTFILIIIINIDNIFNIIFIFINNNAITFIVQLLLKV